MEIENKYEPCPKCGGKVKLKDDWEYGMEVDGEFQSNLRSVDEEGCQYYECTKCGELIQTERSVQDSIEADEAFEKTNCL